MRRIVLIALTSLVACSADNSTRPAPTPAPTPNAKAPTAEVPKESPQPATQLFGLERFRRTGNDAGCPDEGKGDCVSALELTAAGSLELDPWGAPGVGPLKASLSPEDLERVAATLTAADLLAILDHKPACSGANETETMLVSVAGVEHRNATGYCNEAPIQAVRKVLLELASKHFPDNHLICPPF